MTEIQLEMEKKAKLRRQIMAERERHRDRMAVLVAKRCAERDPKRVRVLLTQIAEETHKHNTKIQALMRQLWSK